MRVNLFSLTGLVVVFSNAMAWAVDPPPTLPLARVVRAVDLQKMRFFTPDPGRVHQLVSAAMLKYTGASNPGTAWRKIVQPGDHVGIKIQTATGAVMGTRPALVEAIIEGLEAAGVERNRIIVFDRYGPQMETAGFTLGQRPDGVTVTATVPMVGYDPQVFVDCGIPGKLIWGDLEFKSYMPDTEDQLSTKSFFSRIVTQQVDKFINLPVLTTDPDYGLSGCLLGASLPIIDNGRRFHRGSLIRDEALVKLFSTPVIQKKCVLHILDALVAQYAGGPDFDPSVCLSLQTLFVGQDPVAIDTLAVRWVNSQRPKIRIAPLKEEISYIEAAANAGLGVNDPDRIQIQDVKLER